MIVLSEFDLTWSQLKHIELPPLHSSIHTDDDYETRVNVLYIM